MRSTRRRRMPSPKLCSAHRAYLTHPVFEMYHSETEMLRYLRHLQAKDVALDRSMIPLGSCTMKLNATTEMIPVTWREFRHAASLCAARAGARLSAALRGARSRCWPRSPASMPCRCSPMPAARANMRACWPFAAITQARGEAHRDVCLIPVSAHGTNPASAVMAGMKVVVVACDEQGNVDVGRSRGQGRGSMPRISPL